MTEKNVESKLVPYMASVVIETHYLAFRKKYRTKWYMIHSGIPTFYQFICRQ